MSTRLRLATEGLFVLTEALAWFFAMRVLASVYERGVLRDLAFRIDLAASVEGGIDAIVGGRASEVARLAAETATAGPPWYIVLVAALTAFSLTRFIRSAQLGALGTALGIAVSLAALSLAWRQALVGDLRFWDYSALARFVESSNSAAFQPIDVIAFTANPDPGVADPRASGVALVGMGLLWVRFLFAGRTPLQFDTVLRSFSATFPVVLVTTFVGSAAEVPGGAVAIVYFTSAVLLLAVSNARRASESGARARLDASEGLAARGRALLGNPWAFAAVATLALLLSTGLTLVVFTSLGAGGAILAVGEVVGRIVEFVLVLIITPIYWVLGWVSSWLGLGSVDLSFMGRALDNAAPPVPTDQSGERGRLLWVRDAFRLAGFALLVYVLYRGARYMFSRLESRRADNAEGDRSAVGSAGGFAALLREAFSGRPRPERDDGSWLRRQPAYWLYGRMVHSAVERRFAPRAGETPLEFASASHAALGAPVFASIARAFDRARYGAHYASEEELRPLAVALREWEAANPVTDEIRMKPGRDEEAPQVEIERTPEMPEPPPELMPPV